MRAENQKMKKIISTVFAGLVAAVSVADAGTPAMKVTVSDAGGRVAFKGSTNADGTFSTGSLNAGRYVVQFNATNSAVNGDQYALVISAGKRKVVADSVAGEKFLGGGVAMRLEVGSGLKISGLVTSALNVRVDPKTGKRLVWLAPRIGSNMPGRWVPADSAQIVSARNSGEIRREDMVKWQDHGDTEPP